MSDYISRQDAIDTVNRMMERIDTGDVIDYRDVLVECFKVLPTADVVEVVRCKDCFYSKPYNAVWYLPLKENSLWCSRYEVEKELNWFCADGERREDDKGRSSIAT